MLASLVQSGLRAVEIDSSVSDFDGLMRPGDRVDLLFTSGDNSGGKKSTVTLLQNLLVLSIGGSMEREAGSKRRGGGRGVTISSTLAQAQIITQAKTKGLLSLTLRNPDDVKVVDGLPETTDKEIDDLRAGATVNSNTTSRTEMGKK
jgi:pilus assembly protein CpaB